MARRETKKKKLTKKLIKLIRKVKENNKLGETKRVRDG